MNICFRGHNNNLGRVFLLTGAFLATFSTGYLVAGRSQVKCTAELKPPAVIQPKIETTDEPKAFCDRFAKPASSADSQFKIVSKPHPQYTDVARANKVQGKVSLRVTFEANGEIRNVQPISELPDGLTEQAIAAAKRIEFVPAVRNGKPETTTKIVEYTFSIY